MSITNLHEQMDVEGDNSVSYNISNNSSENDIKNVDDYNNDSNNIDFQKSKSNIISPLISKNNQYVKYVLIITITLCIICNIGIYFELLFPWKNRYQEIMKHGFNISKGYVISMYPERSKDIIYTAKHFLQIPDMSIFNAVNGSEKDLYQKTISEISLYTRYTMSVGRNDHMQLSNVGMLGCLLSHVEVWKRVQPGETIAIFEDDSIIDTTSSERMYNLFYDLMNIEWDILMLESGQPMISQGSWKNIGLYASTCAKSRIKIKENIVAVENDEYNYDKNNYTENDEYNYDKNNYTEISNATTTTTTTTTTTFNNQNDTKLKNDGLEWNYDGDVGSDNSYKEKDKKICTWFGTRGYLLTYNGAQILLNNIFPITVQVDSFIGLVAAFDSNFKMFWTRQNVVHWRYSYLSHVWEHCFKCYMPIDAQFYIIFIIIILLSVFIIIFRHKYEDGSKIKFNNIK